MKRKKCYSGWVKFAETKRRNRRDNDGESFLQAVAIKLRVGT